MLYFENFDPNSGKYVIHAQDIDKIELPGLLMELSKKYFEQLGKVRVAEENRNILEERPTQMVYQCQSCYTVYDKNYGDSKKGIPAGTLFKDIPNSYTCPVCDASKSNFEKVELQLS